jgi:hypothetical protein
MNPLERCNQLLSTVGLLRVQFSKVMSSIHETRQECKKRFEYPPEELSPLMGRAQELFVELLKAGEFLRTARANIRLKEPQAFDEYLEEWGFSQTEERLRTIETYFQDLSRARIRGWRPDPEIWEEGLTLIEEALNPKTGPTASDSQL